MLRPVLLMTQQKSICEKGKDDKATAKGKTDNLNPASNKLVITVWSSENERQYQHQKENPNVNTRRWVFQSIREMMRKIQQHCQQLQYVNLKVVVDLWILNIIKETEWNQLCDTLIGTPVSPSSESDSTSPTTSSKSSVTSIEVTRLDVRRFENAFTLSPRTKVPERLEDDRIRTLLRRVAPSASIRSLTLDHIQYIPNSFQEISSLRMSLVELTISKCNLLYNTAWNLLAESIRQMKHLENVVLKDLMLVDDLWDTSTDGKGQSWISVIGALQSIKTLKSYQFQECQICGENLSQNPNVILTRPNHRYSPGLFVLTPEQIYRCDFFPRLNLAGYQRVMSSCDVDYGTCYSTVGLFNWVNALIQVQDRIDCIHHLMRLIDPTIWASVALETLTKSKDEV